MPFPFQLEKATEAEIAFIIPKEESKRRSSIQQHLNGGGGAVDQDSISHYVHVISDTSRQSPIRFGPNEALKATSAPIKTRDLNGERKAFFEDVILGGETRVKSILVVPVDAQSQSPVQTVLVCLVNKKTERDFGENDVNVVKECFSVVLAILLNALAYEEERRIKTQCQALLNVARNLFTHLDDVGVLLGEVMAEAKNLTEAERCSLFLLDEKNNELIAKVFDGDKINNEGKDLRIPANKGIVGMHIN